MSLLIWSKTCQLCFAVQHIGYLHKFHVNQEVFPLSARGQLLLLCMFFIFSCQNSIKTKNYVVLLSFSIHKIYKNKNEIYGSKLDVEWFRELIEKFGINLTNDFSFSFIYIPIFHHQHFSFILIRLLLWVWVKNGKIIQNMKICRENFEGNGSDFYFFKDKDA